MMEPANMRSMPRPVRSASPMRFIASASAGFLPRGAAEMRLRKDIIEQAQLYANAGNISTAEYFIQNVLPTLYHHAQDYNEVGTDPTDIANREQQAAEAYYNDENGIKFWTDPNGTAYSPSDYFTYLRQNGTKVLKN
mgnify:CR=1 FL=1